MRNTLIAVAIAAVSFGASAQSGIAADAETQVTIDLAGTLEQRCEISTTAAGFDDLDLEVTTPQGSGELSVRCNFSGSPVVTISSLNAGKLKNATPDVDASLAYILSVGDSDLNLSLGDATPAFPIANNGNTLVANAQALSIALTETAVIAGDYTDTITATVSPN